MKKGIALLLMLTLAAGATVPAYAQDTAQSSDQKQTVEVSLGSIEDIMSTYNLDVKTYENSIRDAQHEKDTSDQDTDSAKDAYHLTQIENEGNIRKAILSAKEDYLEFCALNDKLVAAQTTAENARQALVVSQQSLSSGYASQQTCDGLLDQYNEAQNNVNQINNQLIQMRKALKTTLNLPNGFTMDIKPVAEGDLDFSVIPSINYSADLIVMEGNSSAIKTALIHYNQADDKVNTTNFAIENADIAVKQTRTSEEAAFQKLYDSMTSAYTVYQQALDQVQRKQAELTQENKALSLGYSSQKSVDDKTKELKTLQSTLADDRNTLFTSYLSYINKKNGF